MKTEIPNQICNPFKSPRSIKSRKADPVARVAGKIIYLLFLILGLDQAVQTFPGQCLKVRILLILCVSGVVQGWQFCMIYRLWMNRLLRQSPILVVDLTWLLAKHLIQWYNLTCCIKLCQHFTFIIFSSM